MNLWLCSTPGSDTPHPNQASAEAEAARIKAPAVAWCCYDVEPPLTVVPETHETAPTAGAGVVERVLGHLGVSLATGKETA